MAPRKTTRAQSPSSISKKNLGQALKIVQKTRKNRTEKHTYSKRRSKRPDNRLIQELNDAVEDARLTIKHVAKSKIKSTEKSLNHRLAEIAQRVKTTREKDLEARENLLAPLSEDLLELSGEGGLPPIVVSLDERIRLYGKFVADKKKAITGLWTQWDETQKELEALAIEVFGPRALGIIAAVSEGTTNDIVTNAKQEFMETIEAEKSKLKEEIDQMSSRFREEMVAGEKTFNSIAKKERKSFLKMLADDL